MSNLSVVQDPFGCDWPLGFIAVGNIGTPVGIMSLVDANSINAPDHAPVGGWGAKPTQAEYSPTCHKVTFQGVRPGNNNNGMIVNSGSVYIMRSPGAGTNNNSGPGNRSDSGAMVYVLFPGSSVTLPGLEMEGSTISPYRYSLDADNNGDGALVTLLNCARG